MKKYNIKSIYFLCFIFVFIVNTILSAQEKIQIRKNGVLGNHLLDATILINTNDVFLGLSTGYNFKEIDLTFNVLFHGRPYGKKIRIKKSNNYYYQFIEHRYIMGISIDKLFSISENIYISISPGYGFSFGDYSGSKQNPKTKSIPFASIGIQQNQNTINFEIGYQYVPVPNTVNNYLYLSIGI